MADLTDDFSLPVLSIQQKCPGRYLEVGREVMKHYFENPGALTSCSNFPCIF